ncbi:UNVERIFIED_CONTAM: hypothetical protein Sradi_5887000 [Sesamum radiatum]|uniref:Uncharacterized protein n=1 Tax=Sesamum radiatum TaxID=300843 RepID=A0AAW2KS49_SESRA
MLFTHGQRAYRLKCEAGRRRSLHEHPSPQEKPGSGRTGGYAAAAASAEPKLFLRKSCQPAGYQATSFNAIPYLLSGES